MASRYLPWDSVSEHAQPPDFMRVTQTRPSDSHTRTFAGTWQGEHEKVKHAVSYALKQGYKLIDGAYCYGNEEAVGEGIKEALASGIKREDIFVVTKVWATYNTRVELGLEKSLKNLGLDYVDLFLVVGVPLRAIFGKRGLSLTKAAIALAPVDEPRRKR